MARLCDNSINLGNFFMTGRRMARVAGLSGLSALMVIALVGCTQTSGVIPSPPMASAGPGPLYKIGPGDSLGIFVYGAPDLSVASVPVRPDGRISLPLVPDIMAAGKTSVQLGQEIAQRLSEYVKNPNVTVMVNSFHGPLNQQIKVVGAASRPIAIPYTDHMTLLDVMVDAGGLTRFAAGNDAYVIRREDGHDVRIPVKIDALLNRGDIKYNIPMDPGDVVVIPETMF